MRIFIGDILSAEATEREAAVLGRRTQKQPDRMMSRAGTGQVARDKL